MHETHEVEDGTCDVAAVHFKHNCFCGDKPAVGCVLVLQFGHPFLHNAATMAVIRNVDTLEKLYESFADLRQVDTTLHDFARKRIEILITNVIFDAKQREQSDKLLVVAITEVFW